MQIVLVVGLGEIGSTVFTVLKQSQKFRLYGIDFDRKKMQDCGTTEPPNDSNIDVLQVCIPARRQDKIRSNR